MERRSRPEGDDPSHTHALLLFCARPDLAESARFYFRPLVSSLTQDRILLTAIALRKYLVRQYDVTPTSELYDASVDNGYDSLSSVVPTRSNSNVTDLVKRAVSATLLTGHKPARVPSEAEISGQCQPTLLSSCCRASTVLQGLATTLIGAAPVPCSSYCG